VHLGIVLAVYPLIFFGELPDKTMFASLILASRGRPLAVWLGASLAFVVHVAIAVSVGVGLFHLLPHRAVDGLVAALFALGAVLAFRESGEDEEEIVAEVAEGTALRVHRTVGTAFVVIFLAEWGDLTQVLTANLAARYHSPLSVGLGADARTLVGRRDRRVQRQCPGAGPARSAAPTHHRRRMRGPRRRRRSSPHTRAEEPRKGPPTVWRVFGA